MSFKCAKCKKPAPKGEKRYPIPVETRPKTYPVFNRKGKQVRVAEGWETVEEAGLCFHCYQEWQKEQLEVKQKQGDP